MLWFSGVELPAVSGSKLKRGGWIEGYRSALEEYHPEIELGVASYSNRMDKPVHAANAVYFPLVGKKNSGNIQNVIEKWKHLSFCEDEVAQYINLVNEYKPDLVHFHGTENPFGLAAEKISAPSVLSMQANVALCNTQLFEGMTIRNYINSFFSIEYLLGNGILHKKIAWNKYEKVESRIMKTCINFIGRTFWDKAIVESINPDGHYFHCDEIMADDYYGQKWVRPENQSFKLFCTSSNAFFKGAVDLVKAVQIANRMGADVSLHLAGVDSESEVGSTILQIMKHQPQSDSVLLLGRLSPEKIIAEMNSANCFVLPSHIDNSPNSLCEAMLLGMPCIASRVGGIPSLIDEGKTGILYNDREPAELAEKIVWIKENPGNAVEMGKAARQTALKRHDRKRNADQLVDIYKTIAGNLAN